MEQAQVPTEAEKAVVREQFAAELQRVRQLTPQEAESMATDAEALNEYSQVLVRADVCTVEGEIDSTFSAGRQLESCRIIHALHAGILLVNLKRTMPRGRFAVEAARVLPERSPSLRAKVARLAAIYTDMPERRLEILSAPTLKEALALAYTGTGEPRSKPPTRRGRSLVDVLSDCASSAAGRTALADTLDGLSRIARSVGTGGQGEPGQGETTQHLAEFERLVGTADPKALRRMSDAARVTPPASVTSAPPAPPKDQVPSKARRTRSSGRTSVTPARTNNRKVSTRRAAESCQRPAKPEGELFASDAELATPSSAGKEPQERVRPHEDIQSRQSEHIADLLGSTGLKSPVAPADILGPHADTPLMRTPLQGGFAT